MTLLIVGLALWVVVHLIPSAFQVFRANLINAIGDKPYQGAFALLIVLSLVMIVVGWRSIEPNALYIPPAWAGGVTTLLMLNAFALFVATKHPTRIKRFIRHPQLMSVVLWSIAHLISNSETRSLVLFGGMGLWALLEMRMINAREGDWVKPDAPSLGIEIRWLAISVVVFVIAVLLHPYFAGVSPIVH